MLAIGQLWLPAQRYSITNFQGFNVAGSYRPHRRPVSREASDFGRPEVQIPRSAASGSSVRSAARSSIIVELDEIKRLLAHHGFQLVIAARGVMRDAEVADATVLLPPP